MVCESNLIKTIKRAETFPSWCESSNSEKTKRVVDSGRDESGEMP